VLSLLAVSHGATLEKRGLQTLDSLTLQTFTQVFRKTLLDKVAVEWNVTVDMSNKLSADMHVCKGKVETQVNKCKSQAKNTCSANPSFADYLNFVNPYTYLEGPLNDLASKFNDIKDLLGDQAGAFFNSINGLANSVSGGFSSAFTSVKNGINSLGNYFTGLGNTAIDLGNQVGQGVGDLGNQIKDGLTDAGNALEHAGSSIGHAIGHVFGKREIDEQTRKCMARCDQCTALLLPTQSQMIGAVCGQDLINRNNTINSRAQKLKKIVDASTDRNHVIVTKVEFDPASMNGQMQIMTVYITANLNGHDTRYKTSIPYAMMNMPSTAQQMALEYWNKVN
jgi:hypothetical protein